MEMRLTARGVAGVPLLGRYNHTSARPGLREHAHSGTLEICFLVKGCQTYELGGRSFRLTGGDVFLAFPGEKHGTGGLPQEKGVLYWMTLRPPLLHLPPRQSRSLWHALLKIPSRHFRGSWKMQDNLDAITRRFHQPAGSLDAFALASHVGAFLLEVVACAKAAPGRRGSVSLQPVLDRIARRLDEPLPVPALAAEAGLSEARFKVRFKEEVGVPPGEYVLRARVDEARRQLRSGRATITEIAHGLGFSSSQYFATVFQRFTGQTPGAYRKIAFPASETKR